MSNANTNQSSRKKRHRRIRASVEGTAERPRLSVYRSNKYMYAQIIDDSQGETLVASNSRDLDVEGGMLDHAEAVGKDIAQEALEQDIQKVVFDRGGYEYTGRIEALAESARKTGLNL
ncbi:MAG: 50S ribosomal protein L18 [Parcubacteria group bacterium SW_4_46_8]|nr:MAG: 50S ribosomal protein L18 [Parcubacteria group bacterium SW_4_46_8]